MALENLIGRDVREYEASNVFVVGPDAEGGLARCAYLYSPSCREEVFSETQSSPGPIGICDRGYGKPTETTISSYVASTLTVRNTPRSCA